MANLMPMAGMPMIAQPTSSYMGSFGAQNGIGGMNGPMGTGTSGAGGSLGMLAQALMAQRNAQNGGTAMAQQQQPFAMPATPGTQFSMPNQAATYGAGGPSYQNALAQALMNYGGANGG